MTTRPPTTHPITARTATARPARARPATARPLLSLLVALALAACAAGPARDEADDATFVVVRHGEKTSDSEHDPDLGAAGHARAQRLAERLADVHLVAIYTTDFRRTRQTVQPVADAHGIEATVYDARQPAGEFAAALRAAHARGTVLVAGHSNTVPGIVAALCACAVAEMPETEYDRLSIVRIDATGTARLETGRYGASPTAP